MANRLLMLALLGLLLACGNSDASADLTLGGQTIPSNALIHLSDLGSSANGGDSIQCHTDLDSCCEGEAADGGGNWFTPGDQRLSDGGSLYAVPGTKRVDLRRRDGSSDIVPGIYRCEIDTVSTGPGASERETQYVGLYPEGGGRPHIEGGIVSLTAGSDGQGNPQYILTCISAGGPPTTVSWVRDSGVVNRGKRTELDDPVTARYVHTLTVSRRLWDEYRCIVNNRNGRAEASFVQDEVLRISLDSTSATTVSLSWTVASGVAPTSFTVSYSNTNNTECFTSSQGITDIPASETSYTLTGLHPGTQYSVSVAAVLSSEVSFSKSLTTTTHSTAPSVPPSSVTILDATPSTLGVTWSPPDCSQANGDITGYSVSYEEKDSGMRETLTVNGTTGSLSLLKLSTLYAVSVAAINSAGIGPYSESTVAQTSVLDGSSLSLVLDSTSSTSATLSWAPSLPSLSATSYSLSYSNSHCFTDSHIITGLPSSVTETTLSDLHPGTQYSVSLTAALSNGENLQQSLVFTTPETVPDAPPVSVGVSDVSGTTITLQWGRVDCNSTNGAVTGYSVRYREEVSGGEEEVMRASGEGSLEAVISGLRPGTLYTLRVAAVNSAGVGPYTHSVRVATHTMTTLETESTSSSSSSGRDSCTEPLVMTGCIGFIGGLIATLLVCLPTFLFVCRRKPKIKMTSEAPIHQEEEKKNQEDMELSENSAYGSALSSAANSYHDMTPHSYQDVVIYEHVR